MRISKDEYDIRTLAYYQAKGGVYNELITVLTLLRNDPKNRGMAMPAKVLNEACYAVDYARTLKDYAQEIAYLCEISDALVQVVSAVLIMASDTHGYKYVNEMKVAMKKDKRYYPKFEHILKHYEQAGADSLEKEDDAWEIAGLQEELRVKEGLLKEAHEKINEQEETISNLLAKQVSSVDRNLTFEGILAYIKAKKQYHYTSQIINMLKDKLARVATNEEWEKLLTVEQEIMDQTVQEIHNHNDIKNSNVFTGLINDPQFPIGVDPQEFIEKAVAKYLSEINQQS